MGEVRAELEEVRRDKVRARARAREEERVSV